MKKIACTFLGLVCILALTRCNSNNSKSSADTDSTSAMTSADTSNVTANWKLGVQMWTFRKFTFAQALDKVDSAGIKYIEAFWGQPLGDCMKDSFGIRMSDASKAKSGSKSSKKSAKSSSGSRCSKYTCCAKYASTRQQKRYGNKCNSCKD